MTLEVDKGELIPTFERYCGTIDTIAGASYDLIFIFIIMVGSVPTTVVGTRVPSSYYHNQSQFFPWYALQGGHYRGSVRGDDVTMTCCSAGLSKLVVPPLVRRRCPSLLSFSSHTNDPGPLEPGANRARILGVNPITPTVKTLDLKVLRTGDATSRLTFMPGQWVDLFIPGKRIVGGYSICSTPDELPVLRLAVKDGRHPPTKWCYNEAAPGDMVQIRPGGKFGLNFAESHTQTNTSFELEDGTNRVMLIAGGIGINPLFSILQHFAKSLEIASIYDGIDSQQTFDSKKMPKEMVLLYGARSLEEIAFKEEICSVARKHPSRITVHFVVPENNKESPIKSENSSIIFSYGDLLTKDYVARTLCGSYSPSPMTSADSTTCLLCGPPQMIEAVEGHCLASGVPQINIRYERWW